VVDFLYTAFFAFALIAIGSCIAFLVIFWIRGNKQNKREIFRNLLGFQLKDPRLDTLNRKAMWCALFAGIGAAGMYVTEHLIALAR